MNRGFVEVRGKLDQTAAGRELIVELRHPSQPPTDTSTGRANPPSHPYPRARQV
jgi:hypothetical protein